MTTAGPRYPATVTTASVSTESANDWVNASNVGADDGSEAQITHATYDASDISFRLLAQNFGFTIPAGATIDGITVAIDRRCFAGAATDFRVQLLDESGALVGANKADLVTAWPGTSGVASYGGATDTWTWATVTPTKLNDADFGVALSVLATGANTDIGVDFVRVTVDYTVTVTTFERSVAIAATTAVASTASFFSVFERASALGATAAVASAGGFFSVLERSTGISATAAVESAGEFETPPTTIERSAAIDATAAVASNGQRDLLRSAVVSATAAVSSVGQRDLLRSSAIATTATVEAGFVRDLVRTAAFSATGALASAGQRDLLRAAGLNATATVTTAGEVAGQAQEFERSAVLAAIAAVVSNGYRDPSSTDGSSSASSTGGVVTRTGTEGSVTTTGTIGG